MLRNRIGFGNVLQNRMFLLFIIVLFGLILRMLFFSGMGISDSLVYSKAANNINTGKGIDAEGVPTLTTRLGIIYATSFFYRILGVNDLSSVVLVLLTSLSGIILIFYFGRLLFNDKVGLIAALLLSFFPLDMVYSTQLLTDIPSAFFMALGAYLFLYSEKHRKSNFYYLLSGISIGVGYLIRESALLIALFFIFYIVYKKRISKEYLLVPLGVLIVVMIESIIFLKLAGDLLFRFHASQKFLNSAFEEGMYFGRLDFPKGLFHYPLLFATNSLLKYFYLFVLAASIYSIILKKKKAYIILLWLIPLLAYLSFGSASFTKYAPFKATDRYTSVTTIPAILMVAFFLTDKKKIEKFTAPVIMLLLAISITTVYAREDRHQLSTLKEAYNYFNYLGNTSRIIFIDGRSLLAIDYISKYNNKLSTKEYPKDFNGIRDAYVVVNKHMIRNLKEVNKADFPEEIDYPPKNWVLIKEIGKVKKDRMVVYYIT